MSDQRKSEDHQTVKATAESGYDQLRRGGFPPDSARRISKDAAEQVHRHTDKHGEK